MHNVNIYNVEDGSMVEKIKNIIGKSIGFLIIVGIIVSFIMSLLCMNDVIENKDN